MCPALLRLGYVHSRHEAHTLDSVRIYNIVQALNEFSGHDVHLYEAAPRPGGHAHTVNFMQPSKDGSGEREVSVDM